MKGVTFGDYHSYNNFGLLLDAKHIGAPEVKTTYIDVPGADGVLDYTEAFGGIKYGNRQLSFGFGKLAGIAAQIADITTIKNALHGRRLHITLDDDSGYYYVGRVSVGDWESDYESHMIESLTITCDCEPYKYKNAVTTVTRDDLTANYKTLTLTNERRSVVPTITVTEETTLLWGTATYTISAGTYKLPDIVLVQGSNTLKAKLTTEASGSITIEYQEASL